MSAAGKGVATRCPTLARTLGSTAFLGDWIGLIAITAIAVRIGGGNTRTAAGLALSARSGARPIPRVVHGGHGPEPTVPNLVERPQVPNADSLSLAASCFSGLRLGVWLGSSVILVAGGLLLSATQS